MKGRAPGWLRERALLICRFTPVAPALLLGNLKGEKKNLRCHLTEITKMFFFSPPNTTVLKAADAPANTEKDQGEALVSLSSSKNYLDLVKMELQSQNR